MDIIGETIAANELGAEHKQQRHPSIAKRLKLFGAMFFWAVSCAVVCLFMLTQTRGWVLGPQAYYVTGIFGAGAALGFWPAIYAARHLMQKQSIVRILFIAVSLTLWTLFMTACLFALQYRAYFVQWHGDAFSKLWFVQQAFTAAGAVYTYVVLGLRLYLPLALIALFATSWWVNRLPR